MIKDKRREEEWTRMVRSFDGSHHLTELANEKEGPAGDICDQLCVEMFRTLRSVLAGSSSVRGGVVYLLFLHSFGLNASLTKYTRSVSETLIDARHRRLE